MSNFFAHLHTINVHRRCVFRLCCKCGIPWQGIKHDRSKYSSTEFTPGVRYFRYDRSPNESERLSVGYSQAWLHHKGCNKHHFEYWLDYNPVTETISPIKMPIEYVVEMFCDRVAASKTYLKRKYTNESSLVYFRREREHVIMHPATRDLLEELLEVLATSGERAACKYIRNLLRHPGVYNYSDILTDEVVVLAKVTDASKLRSAAEEGRGDSAPAEGDSDPDSLDSTPEDTYPMPRE